MISSSATSIRRSRPTMSSASGVSSAASSMMRWPIPRRCGTSFEESVRRTADGGHRPRISEGASAADRHDRSRRRAGGHLEHRCDCGERSSGALSIWCRQDSACLLTPCPRRSAGAGRRRGRWQALSGDCTSMAARSPRCFSIRRPSGVRQGAQRERDAYVIRNARVDPEWGDGRPADAEHRRPGRLHDDSLQR